MAGYNGWQNEVRKRTRIAVGIIWSLTAVSLAAADPATAPLKWRASQPALSQKLAELADPNKVLDFLERQTAADPLNRPILYALGHAYEALARAALQRLERASSAAPYLLAARAYRAAYFGDWVEARRLLLELRQSRGPQPPNTDSLLQYIEGRLAGAQQGGILGGDSEQKVPTPCPDPLPMCSAPTPVLREALRQSLEKDDPESLYRQVFTATELGRRAFLSLEGLEDSPERQARRAEVAEQQGDPIEAILHWRKALELAPGNLWLKQELARAYLDNQDLDDAEPIVTELLKTAPGSIDVHRLAARLYFESERYNEALPHLLKVAQAEPSDLSYRAALGRTFLVLGQPAEAIPHLEAALEIDQDGSLHIDLSSAYRRLGDRKRADELLQRGLSLAQKANQAVH